MFRLLQVGLIGLATSQNATEGNVKAKMEEYDRNLVLKRLDFYSEYQLGAVPDRVRPGESGRLKTNFKKSYSSLCKSLRLVFILMQSDWPR